MVSYKAVKVISSLLILLGIFSIVFQLNKNSLNALPKSGKILDFTEEKKSYVGVRIIQQYTIDDSNLGIISIAVSFPNPMPSHPLPVLFILGGLETGFDSVKHVSDIGDNILVGYNWPLNSKLPKGISILTESSNIYKGIYKSPGQIAKAIEWVSNQSWSEKEKISLLGFSIGAIASPAVQHIIENRGLTNIGWTVLAYGGTNIGQLVNSNPYIKPKWAKPLFGWIIQLLFNPIDPKEHLEYISGNFLLINGKDDEFIPKESSSLMQKLTPTPKNIIILDGKHMGVGEKQKELLSIIIKETRMWLKQNGAINPNF